MPDKNGQVTSTDFIAPRDQLRIVKKNMEDGNVSSVSIVGDFSDHDYAIWLYNVFARTTKPMAETTPLPCATIRVMKYIVGRCHR